MLNFFSLYAFSGILCILKSENTSLEGELPIELEVQIFFVVSPMT